MSDKYYYNKFQIARQEILEAIQIEQSPGELMPGTNVLSSTQWNAPTWMDHCVQLYIKYVQIFKNLEECFDQTVYPQMRKTIKKFVENVMCRIIQLKKEIIYANMPFGEAVAPLMYVFLDERMIEYKFEPSQFDLPIPRYFREESSESEKRNILLLERLKYKRGGTDSLPEEDVIKFPYKSELNFEAAILIIQNFETGRNNLFRIQRALRQNIKYDGNSNTKFTSEEENRKLAGEFLASVRRVRKNREEELTFLKMQAEPKNKDNPIEISKKNADERKISQITKSKDYNKLKLDLAQKIRLLEEYDIKEEMKDQRRNWISKVTSENKGVPPYDVELFYLRFQAAKPDEKDDAQKKKEEQIAKDKLKKLQDAKKKTEGGNAGPVKLPIYTGPTEKSKQLTNNIEEFKSLYENPSEFNNNEVRFDIAKNEIIGKIEDDIRKEVDAAIQMEIINLRSIFYKGKKDPILSKKGKKGGKKAVVKEKLVAGENKIASLNIDDIFTELVVNGILRRMVPKNLDDLLCDFNYIAKETLIANERMCDIPLFYTKQLVKEFCLYPLGCVDAKKCITPALNSVLFFGPSGCGKTHAAMAVAHHTDALFFDLSPRNIEGKYAATKEETTRLVNMVFRTAKAYQPAVIYFDNAEQVSIAKVKGAVKNKNAERIKRQLNLIRNAITPDMRILIIGCSNKAHHLNSDIFEKCFYFGLPSFSDRYRIIKTEINKRIGKEYDFEFDVLAEATKGYSSESIISSIDFVLSEIRLEKIKFFPLKIHEFIQIISKNPVLYETDFINDYEALYKLSGLAAIHNFLKANKEENEKNNKKKK